MVPVVVLTYEVNTKGVNPVASKVWILAPVAKVP
jgi:hypothetical protein